MTYLAPVPVAIIPSSSRCPRSRDGSLDMSEVEELSQELGDVSLNPVPARSIEWDLQQARLLMGDLMALTDLLASNPGRVGARGKMGLETALRGLEEALRARGDCGLGSPNPMRRSGRVPSLELLEGQVHSLGGATAAQLPTSRGQARYRLLPVVFAGMLEVCAKLRTALGAGTPSAVISRGMHGGCEPGRTVAQMTDTQPFDLRRWRVATCTEA